MLGGCVPWLRGVGLGRWTWDMRHRADGKDGHVEGRDAAKDVAVFALAHFRWIWAGLHGSWTAVLGALIHINLL
jgi:hypothetical protein